MSSFRPETFKLMLQQALASAGDFIHLDGRDICRAAVSTVTVILAVTLAVVWYRTNSRNPLVEAMIDRAKSENDQFVRLGWEISVEKFGRGGRALEDEADGPRGDPNLDRLYNSIDNAHDQRIATIGARVDDGTLTFAEGQAVVAADVRYTQEATRKIITSHLSLKNKGRTQQARIQELETQNQELVALTEALTIGFAFNGLHHHHRRRRQLQAQPQPDGHQNEEE